ELDTFLFRPVPVTRPSHTACDELDRLGVTFRFLTHVEPHEREAKRREPPQHIGKTAVRNEAIACRVERVEAETQRLGELRGGRIDLLAAQAGTLRAQRQLILDVPSRLLDAAL